MEDSGGVYVTTNSFPGTVRFTALTVLQMLVLHYPYFSIEICIGDGNSRFPFYDVNPVAIGQVLYSVVRKLERESTLFRTHSGA